MTQVPNGKFLYLFYSDISHEMEGNLAVNKSKYNENLKDINLLINLTKFSCTSNFQIGELQFTNNLLPTIFLCY